MDVTEHESVVRELRALRHACTSRELSPDHIAELAPVLTRDLGGGKAEVAYDRIKFFSPEAKDQRFVDAALVSFGFGGYTGNQSDRWNEFLGQFRLRNAHVRTARRWSDVGFDVIARSVLDEGTFSQPLLALRFSPGDDAEHVLVELIAEWVDPPSGVEDAYLDVQWVSRYGAANQAVGTYEVLLNNANVGVPLVKMPKSPPGLVYVSWSSTVVPEVRFTVNDAGGLIWSEPRRDGLTVSISG